MQCQIASLFPVPINKNRLTKYIDHENDIDYTVDFSSYFKSNRENRKLKLNNFNIFLH